MFSLNLRGPIVLAPMAGGVSTPELVAAVSGAGRLGGLGAAYLTPAQIRDAGAAVRGLTREAFAINLPAPTLPPPVGDDVEEQLEAVLELRPAVLSFTFGRLETRHLKALRARDILTVGTATGLEEARQLQTDGVDAIVVQGGAAGGLMTAAAVRAVLDAGASFVQCGMAFLRAVEAGTCAPYRAALAAAHEGDTVLTRLTRAFSGRTARGLNNAVTEGSAYPLPYPHQNALTRQMRAVGPERTAQTC